MDDHKYGGYDATDLRIMREYVKREPYLILTSALVTRIGGGDLTVMDPQDEVSLTRKFPHRFRHTRQSRQWRMLLIYHHRGLFLLLQVHD
jgi:hypothetical protein